MARREGNRHRLWTVVDRVDDATRDAIYWQEWALMERYPDVDFDFHILERRGRPLDTFLSLADMDVFLRRSVQKGIHAQ